ncbi:hypothetical protein [Streptomyces hirsutus]|uniref:hypothetical protein n=1 Tax=Streptomyces hirsutus TaxID=35620 RepID=UPI0036C4ED93
MRTRTTTVAYAALLLAAAAALTACEDGTSTGSSKPAASSPTASPSAEQELTQEQKDDISRAAGMPPKPTGAERQELLATLADAAPDVVRYEDKAVDAARNQCSSLNDTGVKRIDWMASQRFTYKDVVTSEAQGKAINEALKASGFCNV